MPDMDVRQPRKLPSVLGLGVAVQPTALVLSLPLGDTNLPSIPDSYLDSDANSFGASVTSIHIGPHLADHGLSSVPSAGILDLGRRFPQARSLGLHCVILKPHASQGALTPLPRFALLESLSINPGFAHLSREASMTACLLLLFPHMPRLRILTACAPMVLRQYESECAASYHDPPFSLNRFICLGGLTVSVCAQIIAHSCSTLEELAVNFGMVGTDTDEARLVAALAQAAPRLRSLRFLDRRRRGVYALRSVSYSLARLETLRIEAPLALPDALALLDGGGVSTLRTLSLWCTRDRSPLSTAELLPSLSRVPLLRSLALRGFEWVDDDADRRALLAVCRVRRIRCHITD